MNRFALREKSFWRKTKWTLFLYDSLIFIIVFCTLLGLYTGQAGRVWTAGLVQCLLAFVCIFASRLALGIYKLIWRYGGIQSYIRLLMADATGFCCYYLLQLLFPKAIQADFIAALLITALNLLVSLAMRMVYRYVYKCGNDKTPMGRLSLKVLRLVLGKNASPGNTVHRVKTAIVGAGRAGVMLAEEMRSDPDGYYDPRCFVDKDSKKVGRVVGDIPVIADNEEIYTTLRKMEIQQIVFAIPGISQQRRRMLYERYKDCGCALKVYDYALMNVPNAKPILRNFDIEELLFRRPLTVCDEHTNAHYKGKSILITGGGGSIGSELCRQLAKMEPKEIILLDIYENGVYDVQQELRISMPALSLKLEICSIANRPAMERVFEKYHPQIVINAAAHKHVPLMENNAIEAIENNVMGCRVVVELCEKYGAEQMLMVSTDKAVNPTNVMGATKRMCEMIVQSASVGSKVRYS